MDRTTFNLHLSKLALALSAEVTAALAEIYWEDLHDLTDEQFVVACTRARREWEKPYTLPPIAVLLGYAAQAERAAGAITDGEAAWAALRSRVLSRYSFGVTRAHDWPDELTREVVRNCLGIDSAPVYTLATLESDFEREQYRRRFVAEYNTRRGTAQGRQAAQLGDQDRPALAGGG